MGWLALNVAEARMRDMFECDAGHSEKV